MFASLLRSLVLEFDGLTSSMNHTDPESGAVAGCLASA